MTLDFQINQDHLIAHTPRKYKRLMKYRQLKPSIFLWQRRLGERTPSSSKNEFISGFLAPAAGFEPATWGLTVPRATAAPRRNELYKLLYKIRREFQRISVANAQPFRVRNEFDTFLIFELKYYY